MNRQLVERVCQPVSEQAIRLPLSYHDLYPVSIIVSETKFGLTMNGRCYIIMYWYEWDERYIIPVAVRNETVATDLCVCPYAPKP